MNTDNKDRNNKHETPISDILKRKPTVQIDVDSYQMMIDDPGVSEARKRELIAIIGRIVVQFIDIGFDVHPVQLARETKADASKKTERLTPPINHAEKEHQKERIDA